VLGLQICCDHDAFGIETVDCADLNRDCISNMTHHSTGAALHGWHHNYYGVYIIELDSLTVFNSDKFARICATVCVSLHGHPKTTITLTVTPERKEPMWDPGCSPQIHIDQFRPVIHTLFDMREGRSITMEEMTDDDEITHASCSIMVSDEIDVKPSPEPDLGNIPLLNTTKGHSPCRAVHAEGCAKSSASQSERKLRRLSLSS
jgi:hypothetical protein